MTDWLRVPSPSGNLAEMHHAADQIEWYARTVVADADELQRIAAAAAAEWIGQASDEFHVQAQVAHRSLDTIAHVHFEAARTIRSYASEWEASKRASEQAHRDIQHALDDYARNAQRAVSEVARHIQGFLHSNPVTDVLSHAVPQAQHVLDRLLGWSSPAISPAYFLVTHADVVEHTAESIVGHIRSGVEWGVSHLMDGIGAVTHLIGGAIHAAINAVHAVEEALGRAVAWALRTAKNAIVRLFEFGKRMAKAFLHLISVAAKALFEFGSKMVHALVRFVDWVHQWGSLLLELGIGLVAVGGLLIQKYVFGVKTPRRMDPTLFDDLSDTAYEKFFDPKDDSYRRYVDERRRLEALSYKDEGTIPGWDRVEDIIGPEGLHVTVFRNPKTGEVVVAFRGSQGPGSDFDMRDWAQDALNEANLPTAQGEFAILIAKQMHAQYGSDLSFTGHSLGGSLAAMASIATGAEATTFNAAGIGAGNYALATAAGGHGASEVHITNFHTTYDILTNEQEVLGLRPAAGAQIAITSNTENLFAAHELDAFVMPDYAGKP